VETGLDLAEIDLRCGCQPASQPVRGSNQEDRGDEQIEQRQQQIELYQKAESGGNLFWEPTMQWLLYASFT